MYTQLTEGAYHLVLLVPARCVHHLPAASWCRSGGTLHDNEHGRRPLYSVAATARKYCAQDEISGHHRRADAHQFPETPAFTARPLADAAQPTVRQTTHVSAK